MKFSWSDRVQNAEVLQRFKKQRKVLFTIKRKTDNRKGHILLRNCLLMHVIAKAWTRREDEKEDFSSYWMTLSKREDIGN